MLVIFASNVKRSNTRNSLPIFRVLVIFTFSLKTGITWKFPARELLAFYSICSAAKEHLSAFSDMTPSYPQNNAGGEKAPYPPAPAPAPAPYPPQAPGTAPYPPQAPGYPPPADAAAGAPPYPPPQGTVHINCIPIQVNLWNFLIKYMALKNS